jgi:thiamine-phosphate pyrophosphorylase
VRGIYAIVDLGTLDASGSDPIGFAEAAIAGGVCALQLRAKGVDGRRFVELSRSLAALARWAEVPLFVNDRADVGLAARARGVHVGQHDMRPRDVHDLAKAQGVELEIGLSTHDEAQALAALEEPISYVAIGPVFSTLSKAAPDPVLGIERTKAIAASLKARRPDLPTVAIGGIGLDNAAALRGVVDCVAVISSICPKKGEEPSAVTERVRALRERFSSALAVRR